MHALLRCMMMFSPLASSLASPMLRPSTHSTRLAFISTAGRMRAARTFTSSGAARAAAPATTVNASGKKPRVLSGIQPTGQLHIGNYFGAIRNWVLNQDRYDNYFMVVDMHAITVPHEPRELSENTLKVAAAYLAAGIDPAKSKIFVQSHVPAHGEMTWYLNCIAPISWLERMVQYKEKSAKQGETSSVGLLDYPVLMAADILLYQAEFVPVGEDQRQHLELARDLVRRFHDKFDKHAKSLLIEPKPLILKEGARIMSLQDGNSKMSKSAENDNSRINLFDSPDTIVKKIKRCKTDAFEGIEWDNPNRPEATNLLNMFQASTGKSSEDIKAETSGMRWGDFKKVLADAVVEHLAPVQARYHDIMADQASLRRTLAEGADAARATTTETLESVKAAMGFLKKEH